jgi:hypothetical protein
MASLLRLTVLALLVLALAGCGGESSEDVRASDSPPGLDEARGFADFTLYYLGDSFRGLPLTEVDVSRAFGYRNWTFIYGECTPVDGSEPSCSPPLQIQNWSICARFPARYAGQAGRAPATVRVHGARTLRAGGGTDLYTGRTAVVLFGGAQDSVIRSLRPLRRKAADRLPRPVPGSIEGRLRCQARFVG